MSSASILHGAHAVHANDGQPCCVVFAACNCQDWLLAAVLTWQQSCMRTLRAVPGMLGPLGISFCCSGISAGLNSGALGVYRG
jgi:hypothetical protein